jgi:hypothetical protein
MRMGKRLSTESASVRRGELHTVHPVLHMRAIVV